MRRALSAVAAGLALAALAAAGWYGYRAVLEQPFARVAFAGDLERLPRAELEALSEAIRRAPAGASVDSIREAARRVPWVRDASVRRRFPDTIEVTFQAHEAAAHWNDEALLSRAGEVFAASPPASAALPRFRGPEGSGRAMLEQHAAMTAALAPLASPIAELRLSPRGAWLAVLDSGLTLQLGRGDVLPRLERFVAAWLKLGRGAEARHVDLRYPNGFAVGTAPGFRASAILPPRGPSPASGKAPQ